MHSSFTTDYLQSLPALRALPGRGPLCPCLQTAEEREEEEERRQHRFKARAMPNFTSLPVFTPDKAKVGRDQVRGLQAGKGRRGWGLIVCIVWLCVWDEAATLPTAHPSPKARPWAVVRLEGAFPSH